MKPVWNHLGLLSYPPTFWLPGLSNQFHFISLLKLTSTVQPWYLTNAKVMPRCEELKPKTHMNLTLLSLRYCVFSISFKNRHLQACFMKHSWRKIVDTNLKNTSVLSNFLYKVMNLVQAFSKQNKYNNEMETTTTRVNILCIWDLWW
jgi:hypothetical protein